MEEPTGARRTRSTGRAAIVPRPYKAETDIQHQLDRISRRPTPANSCGLQL